MGRGRAAQPRETRRFRPRNVNTCVRNKPQVEKGIAVVCERWIALRAGYAAPARNFSDGAPQVVPHGTIWRAGGGTFVQNVPAGSLRLGSNEHVCDKRAECDPRLGSRGVTGRRRRDIIPARRLALLGMTRRGIPAVARGGTFLENVSASTLRLGNNGHVCDKRAKRAERDATRRDRRGQRAPARDFSSSARPTGRCRPSGTCRSVASARGTPRGRSRSTGG